MPHPHSNSCLHALTFILLNEGYDDFVAYPADLASVAFANCCVSVIPHFQLAKVVPQELDA